MKNIDTIRLKEQNEIGGVIGRYLSLTWKGYRGIGLCPFHNDHHPSLMVDRTRQTYICYACGAGGDVISFIRQIEGCDFRGAVERLGDAREKEAPVLALKSPQAVKAAPRPDHSVFLKMLLPYGESNRELLQAYREFEVGISPMQVPSPWYSQRGRLIFPVRDEQGRLRGFSARALEQQQGVAKYIHTSGRDGFKSSELFYGLCRARESILREDRILLCEGFKDTIALHAAGFCNSVGLMGTTLSAARLELLNKYASQVCLVMDGDAAGRQAAGKLKAALKQEEFHVTDVVLPPGEDPDSLFRRLGRDAFREFIREESIEPDDGEWLLVTACLVYRDTPMILGEQELSYPALVKRILQGERVEFERILHRKILDVLIAGGSDVQVAEWTAQYRERYGEWLERYRQVQQKEWEVEPQEMLKGMLCEYLRRRITELIYKAMWVLRCDISGDERVKLLEEIEGRKRVLALLTGNFSL